MHKKSLALIIAIAAISPSAMAMEELSSNIDAYLTKDNIAKLEKNEIVTIKKGSKDPQGKSLGQGRTLALIRKPAGEVWAQLTRHEEHPTFIPHLVKLDRYSQSGNVVGIHETIKLLFSTIQYHVILDEDQSKWTISWKLDKSKKNDINDTVGSWQIKPRDDNSCFIMYSVSVDSGMAFPKPVENFFFNQDFPGVIEALKKHMETGYTK